MNEKVVLVDENDREIGIEDKIKAHKEGKLHRAFSIFIFNSKGEMLLQKRAKNKYHSGGLWTNACCSHPRPNESLENAVHRRLKEEMGFDCQLNKAFHFIYKVNFENGLKEYEFDHVFIGVYDGKVNPNLDEVEDFKWVDIDTLIKDVQCNGDKYTYWFKVALPKVLEFYRRGRKNG
jgi:isopentenyl-diphosphate delta-isomerase